MGTARDDEPCDHLLLVHRNRRLDGQQGQLADKASAGFTSTMTAHGGQETTLLALHNTIHHFGGVIVPPGYTDQIKVNDGNPYGASHVTGADNDEPLGEDQLTALDHLTERVLKAAAALS